MGSNSQLVADFIEFSLGITPSFLALDTAFSTVLSLLDEEVLLEPPVLVDEETEELLLL
jgi:hypothetical protein